ncbi:hypothetical protein KCP76_21100 [Salmonella enterica subsp. enterica serovar Weltevreden]|nr:hypothetical protein KCP76_21100 [Salmonella enterica subsp. enterica serovar Weltevreden]
MQAIAGPFSQVRFCPTGGISPANYRDYLALKACCASAVSGWCRPTLEEAGDYNRITKLAREAVEGAETVKPLNADGLIGLATFDQV